MQLNTCTKLVLNQLFEFNYEDKLPLRIQSYLVYEYSCVHCTSEYVGTTTRTLGVRADEHAGVSFRALCCDEHLYTYI